MMIRKAQAEFALIIGIVVIAAFVAIFAFSPISPISIGQPALTDEQKAVESYVLDAVERSADQILDYTYSQGGYADPSVHPEARFVDVYGRKVAYWQICDTVTIPRTEENIEDGMERLLENTIPKRTDIAGKQVEFDTDKISVDVTIYEEKVKFSVSLPTTVSGQLRTQPYEKEVEARLGRILEFAGDFSRFQSHQRALDENMMRVIRRSNPESNNWLPLFGIQVGPAKKIKWPDIKSRMEEHIAYMTTHTRMWEFPMLGDDDVIPEVGLKYVYIPMVEKEDGELIQYKDIDVQLHYGMGETMTRTSQEFMVNTDPDPVKLKSVRVPPFVIPLPYYIKYDVSFPVMLTVYDEKTGMSFRFLNFINIRDNAAASCTMESMGTQVPDVYETTCEQNKPIPVDVTVTARNGQPRGGVSLTLSGMCDLGTTFSEGSISGIYAPDIRNTELELYDGQSGAEYRMCMDSSSLNGLDVYMPLPETFVMQLYVVEIERSGTLRIRNIRQVSTSSEEKIDIQMVNKADNACMEDVEYAFQGYKYMQFGEDDVRTIPIRKIEDVSGSPLTLDVTERYDTVVSLSTTSVVGKATSTGTLLTYGSFDVENGKNKIYVYAPIINGYSESDVALVNALYAKCGLSTVSTLDLNDVTNPSTNPRGVNAIGCY